MFLPLRIFREFFSSKTREEEKKAEGWGDRRGRSEADQIATVTSTWNLPPHVRRSRNVPRRPQGRLRLRTPTRRRRRTNYQRESSSLPPRTGRRRVEHPTLCTTTPQFPSDLQSFSAVGGRSSQNKRMTPLLAWSLLHTSNKCGPGLPWYSVHRYLSFRWSGRAYINRQGAL